MTRPFNGQLMDVRSAAALLGTSERSVRARIGRKLLPYRRLGSRIVFRRDELEQFLDALPGCSVEEAQDNVARHADRLVPR